MREERIRIEVLGGLRLICNGRMVDRYPTQKTAALLGRLALFPDRLHPREELIDLFWPESDEESGRHNLRQTLLYLRRALEPLFDGDEPVLLSSNGGIRLAPGSFETDAAELETRIQTRTTSQA